jgi:hypothetical protein
VPAPIFRLQKSNALDWDPSHSEIRAPIQLVESMN